METVPTGDKNSGEGLPARRAALVLDASLQRRRTRLRGSKFASSNEQ